MLACRHKYAASETTRSGDPAAVVDGVRSSHRCGAPPRTRRPQSRTRKPSTTSPPHDRQVGLAQVGRVALEQLGDRAEDLADARSPSQAPTSAASTVSACRARRKPALLAQHDLLGVLGAGRADGLLLDVGRATQPRSAQRRQRRSSTAPRPRRAIAGPIGCSTSYGHSRSSCGLPPAPRPAQVDPAEADGLDALLLEPGQPGVVAVEVVGPPWCPASLSHSSTYVAGSTTSRCTTSASQSSAQPGRQPLVPGPAARDHPVGEHLAPAAVGEVVGAGAHDVLDDPVAGQPGVAVDQPLAGRRRDHERRVGRDQVEALARHRLEEASRRGRRPRTSLSAALSRVSQQRALR